MRFVVATGLLLACFAMVLDAMVRLRLRDAGERFPFWRGGTLDYGKYLKLCREKGWSPWSVYLIPAFFFIGIACIVLGLFRF